MSNPVLLTVRLRAVEKNPILGFIKTIKHRRATMKEQEDLGTTDYPMLDYERIGKSIMDLLEDRPQDRIIISWQNKQDLVEFDAQQAKKIGRGG